MITNKRILKAYEYGERFVVGVSGGKDSTATCLYLIKNGVDPKDFEKVFMDTGWEHPKTYEYLNYLESIIGKITYISANIQVDDEHKDFLESIEKKLGRKSQFVRIVLKYTMFPTHLRKSCTRYTKLHVLKDWLNVQEYEYLSLTGVRREESQRRSKSLEFEYNTQIKCYTWKPILDWKLQDVVDIHTEFSIPPNPLYLDKSDRVGCYPCIHANKSQIEAVDEERKKIIIEIEEYVNDFLSDKEKKTYFTQNRPFEEIYDWAKTSYGGKQYKLFDMERPRCELWGLCGV